MYRWNEKGPVFEFPTPFGVENRFLHWRGRALLVLAFCVVAVGVYGHKFLPEPPTPLFGDPWYRAPRWPHLVCALLLALVGGLDLYLRKLQQLLHLTPGQPASLTGEVSREASGSSGGARALMQMLAGAAPPPEAATLDPRWQRWLGSLGGGSVVLQRYVRARGLLALLAGGLAIVLALAALLPGGAAVQGAVALLLITIVTVADGRHLLKPHRPTPSVALVATLVLVTLLAGVALALVGGRLGALQPLARLDLPVAALVLLGGALAAEALALRVARQHAQARPRVASVRHDVASEWVGDIRRFMADVDRQLFRRWAEGIPNRRYTWLPPRLEAPGGALSAQVLEESQPAPLPAPLAQAAAAAMPGLGLLNALYLLALVLPVLGGLACLGSGYLHYVEPLAVWDLTTLGLAALLAGVYAGRLAHTLCSRTEVQSTLTWLELEGQYSCPPTDPRERTPTGAQVLPPVTVESLTLRACAAPVRSAFYAESAATLGGRVLLEVDDNAELARSWGLLAADGNRAGTEPAAPAAAPATAPARPRPAAARPRQPDPPPPRRAPRFCSACGTPVLSGARFCQHCGNVLSPD